MSEEAIVMSIDPKERYSALVELWTHQNSTQFQWPALILGAVFVAVSLLVDKVTIGLLVDTTKWGMDPQVRFGAGLPLLFIGTGTLIMAYAMGRHRKVMRGLEDELDNLDSSFSGLMHPGGPSGTTLVWGFMAIIALAALILGVIFFAGAPLKFGSIISLLVVILPWIYLCFVARIDDKAKAVKEERRKRLEARKEDLKGDRRDREEEKVMRDKDRKRGGEDDKY